MSEGRGSSGARGGRGGRGGGSPHFGSPRVDHRMPPPPNEKDFKEQKAALDAELADLQAQLKTITAEIDAQAPAKGQRSGTQNMSAELRKLRATRDSLYIKKDELAEKIRDAQADVDTKKEAEKALQAQPRGPKVENYPEAISKLEEQLIQEGADVAKLTADLEKLRLGQAASEAFKAARKAGDDARKTLNKFRDEQKATNDQLSEVKKEEEKIKKQLDAIRAAQDKESEGIKGLNVQREEIRRKIDDCYSRRREAQAAHQKAQSEYWEKTKEIREQLEEERKQKAAQLAAEKEAKRKEKEAELASIDPYEEHKAICGTLVAYLKTLQGDNNETAAPVQQKKEIELEEGAKIINKKAEQESEYAFLMNGVEGGAGKKNKKKKGGLNVGKSDSLTMPISVIGDFGFIKVKAPLSRADIPATLEAIQERKQFYDTAPRPGQKKAAAAAPADNAAQKEEPPKAEEAAAAPAAVVDGEAPSN
eukprot:comp22480_c0_seq1/m.33892 comp22480_c0_seq1/g.33892  ORF comp22480_c0_seq1/g.33892 comp22480_c0_seq1/m.33892 type:complete len:478 (-) comp22480_c0_seq1:523-1956(-)